jgi:hypothetical protein
LFSVFIEHLSKIKKTLFVEKITQHLIIYSKFVWRDSFIIFSWQHFQKYNLTTQLWSNFNTTPPAELYTPACLVLPSEEVLVVGGQFDVKQTLLYNHVTNTWKRLPDTNAPQGYTNTVYEQIWSENLNFSKGYLMGSQIMLSGK